MSVSTFYSLVVLNVYRIAMVTGQVAEVLSPKTFSHVTRNSESLCPTKNYLKDHRSQTIYFFCSFPTMLWRFWVMRTLNGCLFLTTKVSVVYNSFVPTDIFIDLTNLYHLLFSDNTMKALTKQKMIIWSELKCVWIPNLKAFCTQERVITLRKVLALKQCWFATTLSA